MAVPDMRVDTGASAVPRVSRDTMSSLQRRALGSPTTTSLKPTAGPRQLPARRTRVSTPPIRRPLDSTRETARLLDEAARTEDEARRQRLRDEAVRLNLPAARAVARRFRNRGIPDDDLLQVACLGLVQAVQRFDVDQGHDFLSFAVPTMRGELRRHFRDQGWMIRPPREIQELQARIGPAEEELTQLLGRTPGAGDLAALLAVPEPEVRSALAATGCFSPASLDRPRVDGSPPPIERLGSEDEQRAVDTRLLLVPLLLGLSPRDRQILCLRFFEGRHQREIGDVIGISQMQVSRLLTRILRDLRRHLDGEHEAGHDGCGPG